MWHADANLELRLGAHTSGWLQVRSVGTLDGANHLRIKITPEVGWYARFTGWMRLCGHAKGSAVRSGQVVESCHLFAMAAGQLLSMPAVFTRTKRNARSELEQGFI